MRKLTPEEKEISRQRNLERMRKWQKEHKEQLKEKRHLIENYDKALADEFKGCVLHHRLECTIDGEFAHSAEELKRMGMYYNRPYYELIYLTRSEHSKLHYRSGHSLPNKRSIGK